MIAKHSIAGGTENNAGEPAIHIKKGDKTASAWLVALAQNNSQELFRDQFGASHALVDGEPVPLDGGAHTWLRKLLWNMSEKTAKREDLSAATETLAMLASFGEERTLHIRAAQHGGRVYVWAGPHNVIEVDQDGWRRVTDAPVLFRRVPTLKPLPNPKTGGDLTRFNHYVRLRHAKDQRLNMAWIVTAYLANIPRPINLGTGVQGAAKSTGQRAMKRALDPAMPEDFKLRRKDFAQNLDNCFVPLFDNAGPIDEDQSDDMCRATTGSGNADRKLYSDNQSVVRQYKRAMLVNGINNPTERGDFMDRALPVEYERIPKSERRAESDLWAEFEQDHPALLGAVLDALSGAIRLRTPLAETPRLADWAEYAAAVYEYMGWGRDQFAKDWNAVEEKQHEAALEGSPVAQAVRKLMEDRSNHADTAAKLHDELTTVADGMGLNPDRNRLWPKTSNMLWKRIKEASPTLETYGIRAEQVSVGRGKDKRRVISLRGASSGASFSTKLTDQEPDTYAVGSCGVSGASSDGNPSLPIPRTKGEDIEEGDGRGDTEKFPQNADPVDPAGPNAYLSHITGVSSTNQADPVDPTIDDPWLWEEKLDPQTGKVAARIFHSDVEIPKLTEPAQPDRTYPAEGKPRWWIKSSTREVIIDPESAIGLPAGGSRSYRAARNRIQEYRKDWEGYALPVDAEGWRDLLINGEGEFFTLDAVEQALEAA